MMSTVVHADLAEHQLIMAAGHIYHNGAGDHSWGSLRTNQTWRWHHQPFLIAVFHVDVRTIDLSLTIEWAGNFELLVSNLFIIFSHI